MGCGRDGGKGGQSPKGSSHSSCSGKGGTSDNSSKGSKSSEAGAGAGGRDRSRSRARADRFRANLAEAVALVGEIAVRQDRMVAQMGSASTQLHLASAALRRVSHELVEVSDSLSEAAEHMGQRQHPELATRVWRTAAAEHLPPAARAPLPVFASVAPPPEEGQTPQIPRPVPKGPGKAKPSSR